MQKPGAHQAKKKKTAQALLDIPRCRGYPSSRNSKRRSFKMASKVLKWLNKVIKSIQEH